MSYINLKLPNSIVTVFLPPITTEAQTVGIDPSGVRVTRAANRRVTRGGNVRVTHYTITAYPEIVGIKLAGNQVNAYLPE